jgi:hypothetical protein
MTNEKLLEAFAACERLIRAEEPDAQPSRFPGHAKLGAFSRSTVACHLLYMCLAGDEFVLAGRREKAMRWLGFIQASLCFLYPLSIDDLKTMNRPDSSTYSK